MCGVFGIYLLNNKKIEKEIISTFKKLLILSETRGKEASGLIIKNNDKSYLLKDFVSSNNLVKSANFGFIMDNVSFEDKNQSSLFIGHSRLATNGYDFLDYNNQPILYKNTFCVHNGIIVNDAELWKKNKKLLKEADIDTEIFVKMFNDQKESGLCKAFLNAFNEIDGASTIALSELDKDYLLIGTNNGSLYYCSSPDDDVFIFASEKYILNKAIANLKTLSFIETRQLHPGNFMLINADKKSLKYNTFTKDHTECSGIRSKNNKLVTFIKEPDKLKRCAKCVLPETFPFIDFDEHGICNYCRDYDRVKPKGIKELEHILSKYRSKDGSPDCIVAFSGGRDSCYGVHYLKKELKMNPIIYTYDWGMVTDLARRNTARMCSALGLEHILVSADIPKKRKYVKKNVEAWLKKPNLGMVPLFMAGDKQFFYHAERLKKQLGIELLVFCDGNQNEKTNFKTGFMGIEEGGTKGTLFNIDLYNKIKLMLFYIKQYVLNPRYINQSIVDTILAFYYSYFFKKKYIHLYHYVDWNEDRILDTLTKEYNWEKAKDTKATWRIGDGTAPFYNYIYYTVAGFSEHDTFRSNQIRNGELDRKKALELLQEDNKPRLESIKEYSTLIGVSFSEIMRTINKIPRLY